MRGKVDVAILIFKDLVLAVVHNLSQGKFICNMGRRTLRIDRPRLERKGESLQVIILAEEQL